MSKKQTVLIEGAVTFFCVTPDCQTQYKDGLFEYESAYQIDPSELLDASYRHLKRMGWKQLASGEFLCHKCVAISNEDLLRLSTSFTLTSQNSIDSLVETISMSVKSSLTLEQCCIRCNRKQSKTFKEKSFFSNDLDTLYKSFILELIELSWSATNNGLLCASCTRDLVELKQVMEKK